MNRRAPAAALGGLPGGPDGMGHVIGTAFAAEVELGRLESAAARRGADLGQMGRVREARRTGSVPGTSG